VKCCGRSSQRQRPRPQRSPPDHNPIGPFDFDGVYDARSDRRRTVSELLNQGYADAYHHFIEPLLAAGEG
jgi:hypothetical protein